MTAAAPAGGRDASPLAVFANRPFLLLWLAQAATQIGGNMVLYGLTVIVASSTSSNTAVSALFLTFLVPAVLLSAVAGVYVDRYDRRMILVVTNVLRAFCFVAIYFAGDHLAAILLLNIAVSVLTVFFAPAEASMIPSLVPRSQLVSANGIFTLTLNAAFALGFALIGPIVVAIAGPSTLLVVVVILYALAAVFCWTLPSHPPSRVADDRRHGTVQDAEQAVEGTFDQLREGIAYIRGHRNVSWSLIYLGIAASLVGIIGVLGPAFAEVTLGLEPKDLVVVVLPLGLGIVTGVLLLNAYGRYIPRRRVIEGGLIGLGIVLSVLVMAGPISRFLAGVADTGPVEISAVTSLVAVVVFLGFVAGIFYGIVAIPSQTQLQEDLPGDVRGRVFGVLNMLVSISSILPIIIVGPISDAVGTTTVILVVAVLVFLSGIVSIIVRGPLSPSQWGAPADRMVEGRAVDSIGVAIRTREDEAEATGPIDAIDAATEAGAMDAGVPTDAIDDDGGDRA